MYNRRLIDYLPPYLKNYQELKAITDDAEQPEIESLWVSLESTMNDQFIPYATENGVSRWESILGITPKETMTLDERKFTIITRLNEELPFTQRRLEDFLKGVCGEGGYVYEAHNEDYIINIKLALANENNYQDVVNYLSKVIPANMIANVIIMYNSHEQFSAYTHSQLGAYTHDRLRKEVFNQ